MYEFCPLCSKRGFRRRIKALQLNCHEAVWACEEEECEWPFGYEDFVYILREAGSTWSCYWDDSKPPLQQVNECVPVSTELSLYTPPETPGEVVIKDCSPDVQSSNSSATTNDLNNIVPATEKVAHTLAKSQNDTKTDLKEQGNNFTEKNTSSNLKITTVKIDGLPPVILSYEAPVSLSMPTTVSNKGTNLSTTQCVTTSASGRVLGGQGTPVSKQYAKFSFSAIKKKMQATNNNDSLSSDNKCLPNFDKSAFNNEGTNQIQKEDPSKAIASCYSIDTNKFVKKKILKTEPRVSGNTYMESNLNLDTLLDDIMKEEGLYDKVNENHELSDIDEDWINSLLY
ncbi:hypothetical protein KPH14_011150 [Odynerus spinipes]|uniref:Uncharacterized protein n=1 Tax=Odynerus spinipes TaxID=1348599 RepID=A0AAD9RH37_9HYME|nr:hypothetical protein KPH14_011150 [Odynerus spinipes]